jgi:hypothetical protein
MTWTPLFKKIFLKENPRKGICQKCHRKVGDDYVNCFCQIAIVKETHIHHIGEYNPNDPLKDTIELCASCHRKEHWRLEQVK